MKQKSQHEMALEHNKLTRFIDRAVSTFLFITLLALFGSVFKKLFGSSDFAWLVGLIVFLALASIAYAIIDNFFSGFLILLICALPIVALTLVFLLV
jgi:hypothetical protein